MIDLQLDLSEEVEVLRAIYGDEAVRVVDPPIGHQPGTYSLEVDLQPLVEEGSAALVWVMLTIQVPPGYPLEAVPKVEVEKSRGIGDVAIEAMMDAAKTGIKSHGLQEGGCLAPLLGEINDALGKVVSECSICMMECEPSDATFVACGCVFHQACLGQWRELKDKEKEDKALAATTSIKSERDALARQLLEAEQSLEEMSLSVVSSQQALDEAVKWSLTLQKRASIAAGNEEEEEEVDEDEMHSSDESEEDDEDRWGTPQPSMAVGWGTGKKKRWKASTTRNKRRPRKYLRWIEDKLDEMKAAAKLNTTEEVAEAVRQWEKAQHEAKEAQLVLNKAQEDERKAQERVQRVAADLAYMNNYLDEEKAKFTSLPLLCPVCQNNVDGELQLRNIQREEEDSSKDDSPSKQQAAEKAAEEAAAEEARLAEEQRRRYKEQAARIAAVEGQMLKKMAAKMVTGTSPASSSGANPVGQEESEAEESAEPLQEVVPSRVLSPPRAALPDEKPPSPTKAAPPPVVEPLPPSAPLPSSDLEARQKRKAMRAEARRKADEELIATIGQLMEAYQLETVSSEELIVAFDDLLSMLGNKRETDREIREVVIQMVESLEES